MSTNGRGPAEGDVDGDDALETVVDSSGWFSVQLRYAYVIASADEPYLVEDRVVLLDGEDEETALGRGFEIAAEYEDDFETDEGAAEASASKASWPSRSSTMSPPLVPRSGTSSCRPTRRRPTPTASRCRPSARSRWPSRAATTTEAWAGEPVPTGRFARCSSRSTRSGLIT